MENSSEIMNETYTYYTLEQILEYYGSTPFLDTFNLYPFTIVAVLSVLLNTASFIIFMQRDFDTLPLYTYLRVYSFNNIIYCLPNLLNFTYSTIRYLPWSWSYLPQFFYSFIYCPIINLSFSYANVLGIFILLDRVATFKKELKRYLNRAKLLCLIGILGCMISEIPSYLQYDVALITYRLNRTTDWSFWFSVDSQFALEEPGKTLVIINIVVRDGLTVLIEIGLNFYSVALLKSHMAKRKRILSLGVVDNMSVMPTVVNPATKLDTNNSRKKSIKQNRSSVDLNATIMVIFISTLSLSEHAASLTGYIYPMFDYNLTTYILFTVSNFMGPLRRLVDFFVFFYFNKIFKRVCLRILTIQSVGT